MKSKLPLLLIPLLLCAGCNWNRIRGNRNITTETRPVTEFTLVNAGGYYEIQWQPGPPSLRVITDENLQSHVETRMEGTTLRIDIHGPLSPTKGIKLEMTSAVLTGSDLSGAGRLEAQNLTGNSFALETSGACRVTLAGQVGRLLASLTGASKLEAADLKCNDVEVSVTGAGKADITASNLVKAAITGAGKVTYGGQPKSIQRQITGAGKIEPRD